MSALFQCRHYSNVGIIPMSALFHCQHYSNVIAEKTYVQYPFLRLLNEQRDVISLLWHPKKLLRSCIHCYFFNNLVFLILTSCWDPVTSPDIDGVSRLYKNGGTCNSDVFILRIHRRKNSDWWRTPQIAGIRRHDISTIIHKSLRCRGDRYSSIPNIPWALRLSDSSSSSSDFRAKKKKKVQN